MEKRRNRRYARRVRVRFGDKGFSHAGFTSDVSSTGLFVVTGNMFPVKTRLHLEVTTENERQLFFEAVVMRQRVVAPELRQVIRGGLGLRLLAPSELVPEMVPQLRDKSAVALQVTYHSTAELRTAFEKELSRGGVFVWSHTPQLANSVVGVEFDFPFASRSLVAQARVVHTLPEQDGRHGVGLIFIDGEAVVSSIATLVGEAPAST